MKTIIAFAGSNSENSINQAVIDWIAPQLKDVEVDVLDFKRYVAPIFSLFEESKGFPKNMVDLANQFKSADGFIMSSPEHNGSIPAVLKNTIDWLSRIDRKPFNDKPMVLLSVTPGPRAGAGVLEHLNNILPHQGTNIIGSYGVGSFQKKFVKKELVNDVDKENLLRLINELVSAI